MPGYQNAAQRRLDGKPSSKSAPAAKPQKPNMGAIQSLIDVTQASPDQGPIQVGMQQPPMQGPLGRNMQEESQPYNGPGAMQLQEALGKLGAGVDEPGPPQDVIRRMKKQQMQMSLQPPVADLAARYGVIPRG